MLWMWGFYFFFLDFPLTIGLNFISIIIARTWIKFQIQHNLHRKNIEMCQYDTDTPAQGHPCPHAGILQKMKLEKGP